MLIAFRLLAGESTKINLFKEANIKKTSHALVFIRHNDYYINR